MLRVSVRLMSAYRQVFPGVLHAACQLPLSAVYNCLTHAHLECKNGHTTSNGTYKMQQCLKQLKRLKNR